MSDRVLPDQTTWVVNPYPWEESQRLADSLGVPLLAAMVLSGRGIIDPEDAHMFLEGRCALPDPFLFAHMAAAVGTVSDAIDEGKRIVVHGDYDADGITATALLVLGLRDFGLQPEWYLPSRFNEGYGLSRTAVEAIASQGPAVLITVDCGVNYPDEVQLARDKGLEVIVVDHHQPGPTLPDCSLIHEVAGDYPSGDLCGVGLALKLLHALHIHRCGAERETLPLALMGMLDLVAIGTIADLAPLRGENRYYVKEGLKLLAIGQRVGLRALSSVASCTGAVDSGTVAYRLAPRLNAAGRLADPSPPLRLLLTEDEKEARELAAKLHELNGLRQDVERQILEEAVRRVDALPELPPALVLAGDGWHEGVVGIVAARLVERYHRPTILLGVREGVAKGSGRSIPAYDLMAALNACSSLLTVYGGHKQAVGLTLDPQRVEAFREAVEAHARMVLDGRDLIPAYRADAILRGEDINADTATALAALGPFGTGNPKPRLLVVDGSVENAEPTRDGAHLRCMLSVDGVRARGIGFGLGHTAAALKENAGARTVGVQLRVNEWQGTLRPEFLVERVGLDQTGSTESLPCAPARAPGAHAVPAAPANNGRRRECRDDTTLCFPRGRDLRGRPGLLSAVAQVLASGQPTVLLTCSACEVLPVLQQRLPLEALCGGHFPCVGRACEQSHLEGTATPRVVLAEWDAAQLAPIPLSSAAHLVALDPPYRRDHVAGLRAAAEEGAAIHLYYGAAERQASARLLRYLVHPRFAMVCLFRAVQQGVSGEDGAFPRAIRLAWEEAGVVLAHDDLTRAATVLEELDCARLRPGEAKLDARNSPTYVAAEAEYEECVRLCLTL